MSLATMQNCEMPDCIISQGTSPLAKGHLDILKKNTTREISNDAISLGMLITDNTALDTTDAVMQEFANIELINFSKQEKLKRAI